MTNLIEQFKHMEKLLLQLKPKEGDERWSEVFNGHRWVKYRSRFIKGRWVNTETSVIKYKGKWVCFIKLPRKDPMWEAR